MAYKGNIVEDQTIDFLFTSIDNNTPTTLAGSPVVSVYKGNNVTQSVAGVTLVVDFDGITGTNHVRVVTTDAFYAAGEDYTVILTAGTIGGISVAGRILGSFSVEGRYMRGTDSGPLASAVSAIDAVVGQILTDTDITLPASIATIDTNVNTLITRIPAALFSGLTSFAEWLGLLAGKQVGDATARTEMRATGSGAGTFDETTDSQESLRNNQGGGNATLAKQDSIIALIGTPVLDLASDLADVHNNVGQTVSNTNSTRTDLADGGRLDIIFDAILLDTDATIPGLITALENVSAATIGTTVDASLEAIHLDHLLAVDYDPATKPGASTSLLNELIEDDGGVSRLSSNSTEQAPTGGGGQPRLRA